MVSVIVLPGAVVVRSKVDTTLDTTVLPGAVVICVLVMSSVEAGCIESTVVVPSGRVIRLVYVTAGAILVETIRLVIVLAGAVLISVVTKVDTTLDVTVVPGAVVIWVLVMSWVDAGWIERTVVVPSRRVIRLV